MRDHERGHYKPGDRCPGCEDREPQHGAWWCENCFFEPFPMAWPHYCDDKHPYSLEKAARRAGMEIHEVKEKP
jgi:hypothetical protein